MEFREGFPWLIPKFVVSWMFRFCDRKCRMDYRSPFPMSRVMPRLYLNGFLLILQGAMQL